MNTVAVLHCTVCDGELTTLEDGRLHCDTCDSVYDRPTAEQNEERRNTPELSGGLDVASDYTKERNKKAGTLTVDAMALWQSYGLPASTLSAAMKKVGDVDSFASDPAKHQEYLDELEALAITESANGSAPTRIVVFMDDVRRSKAFERWNTKADDAGFPKHTIRRGDLWKNALGCPVPEFRGTEEEADAKVDAALAEWKAAQQPQSTEGGSALDKAFPRDENGQPADEKPAAREAVDQDKPAGDTPPQAATDTQSAPDTPPAEAKPETPLTGDTKPAPLGLDALRGEPSEGPKDKPSQEEVEEAARQIADLMKEAFPGEDRSQLINRYKEASGTLAVKERIQTLGTVQTAIDEVKVYIEANHPDDEETEDTQADDPLAHSAGWDGQLSGNLIVQASALARTLRGPQANVSIAPERLAEIAYQSGLYPGINTFAKAMMVIWTSIELGIPPTTGLQHFQVNTSTVKDRDTGRAKGTFSKLSQSIHLMMALALASGEMEDFQITADGKVITKRRGLSAYTTRFNPTGKDPEKDARQAIRLALRRVFGDVLTFGLRALEPKSASGVEIANSLQVPTW